MRTNSKEPGENYMLRLGTEYVKKLKESKGDQTARSIVERALDLLWEKEMKKWEPLVSPPMNIDDLGPEPDINLQFNAYCDRVRAKKEMIDRCGLDSLVPRAKLAELELERAAEAARAAEKARKAAEAQLVEL